MVAIMIILKILQFFVILWSSAYLNHIVDADISIDWYAVPLQITLGIVNGISFAVAIKSYLNIT